MDLEEIIREQMDNVLEQEELDGLSEYAEGLSGSLSENFTIDKLLESTLNGKSIFDSEEIISSLQSLFLYEIKSALWAGVEILAICIFMGLLQNLSGSFGKKGVSDVAGLIMAVSIIGIAMTNFHTVFQMTEDAIGTITYTMEILLPILLGLLIAMGQVTSGTVMSPLLMGALTLFESIIKNVVLPAIFLSAVLTLINCLTEKDYVNHMSKFLRQAALFVVGLLMTLMSGMIAIQGLVTKTSDSLLMGTARYSLDNFIPIVGGFTADTIELFLNCMGSIKSVVGIFGILLIITIILSPMIKILAIAVIYKVTALLIEPVTTKKLAGGIGEIGSSLIAMGSILLFASLLFIIFIAAMIRLGGVE